MLHCSYDTDRNGYVDHKEFIAKLGLEFAAGDTDGHSKRIIEVNYDSIMPYDFKDKIRVIRLLYFYE